MELDHPIILADSAVFLDWWNSQSQRISESIAFVRAELDTIAVNSSGQFISSSLEAGKRQLEQDLKFLNELAPKLAIAAQNPTHCPIIEPVQQELMQYQEVIQFLLNYPYQQQDRSLPISQKQRKLFVQRDFEPLPTGAPFISSIQSQIRKDLWSQDNTGVAVFTKIGKSNPSNYIQHYISSPGDVAMLPWDQAEEIINKFGFNTVKLQLILAAHAMNQPEPWSGTFTLSGADLIRDLGWDARKDIPMSQKLAELASAAYALDCLLVKVEWDEGTRRKGQVKVTVQASRMWNIGVTATGQRNLLTQELDDIEKLELQVQPGLWTKGFLNRGGAKAREALYQFGYLGQSVLRIDPYHDELALRLAIHLTLESRIHKSGAYRVQTLLQSILPGWEEKLSGAQENRFKARDLLEQWNRALKTLVEMGWSLQYDDSYPECLRLGSESRKPKGYFNSFLDGKLFIKPPNPIPELLAGKQPSVQASNSTPPSVSPLPGLKGAEVRQARKAKGWSQAKLAGTAGLSQQLISHIESGRREITPEVEHKLRGILKLEQQP